MFPEEDQSKNFMVSLIIQQLYRELLIIADEKGGRLDRRVMFYVDEFGTSQSSVTDFALPFGVLYVTE